LVQDEEMPQNRFFDESGLGWVLKLEDETC
jgi:hypothetical protein